MLRLTLISTIEVPAIGAFSVDTHFRVGETDGVKISWIGEDFRRAFGGRVEDSVAEATLHVHKLIETETDVSIIAELGGEAMAEVTLGQLWCLLKAQGYGQEGNLLVDGRVNIAHVRAADLWSVYCRWLSLYGGWRVRAGPMMGPGRWGGGDRVVSR